MDRSSSPNPLTLLAKVHQHLGKTAKTPTEKAYREKIAAALMERSKAD